MVFNDWDQKQNIKIIEDFKAFSNSNPSQEGVVYACYERFFCLIGQGEKKLFILSSFQDWHVKHTYAHSNLSEGFPNVLNTNTTLTIDEA